MPIGKSARLPSLGAVSLDYPIQNQEYEKSYENILPVSLNQLGKCHCNTKVPFHFLTAKCIDVTISLATCKMHNTKNCHHLSYMSGSS